MCTAVNSIAPVTSTRTAPPAGGTLDDGFCGGRLRVEQLLLHLLSLLEQVVGSGCFGTVSYSSTSVAPGNVCRT